MQTQTIKVWKIGVTDTEWGSEQKNGSEAEPEEIQSLGGEIHTVELQRQK